jgi:hypothetical protein
MKIVPITPEKLVKTIQIYSAKISIRSDDYLANRFLEEMRRDKQRDVVKNSLQIFHNKQEQIQVPKP